MTEEELIESGLLEGYVTGSISANEQLEVQEALVQFPSVLQEIESIEQVLMRLSQGFSGNVSPEVWSRIANSVREVKSLKTKDVPSSRNLSSLTGWAAAILCLAGLFWMLKENNDLKQELRTTQTQQVILKDQIEITQLELAESNNILEVVRSQKYKVVQLPGNADVAPNAYATVYYNAEEKTAYVDASGLPAPPRGKVYQAWSLIMEPLTPRNIGLLGSFEDDSSKFFKIENIPSPEAFGITLEPAGGSEAPTLSQLYVIGTVGQ